MADKKITQLDLIDAIAAGDLFVVVDDPSGTPTTKRATATQVADMVFGNGLSVTSLTAASALDGTESRHIVQGGADRKSTPLQEAAYVLGKSYLPDWVSTRWYDTTGEADMAAGGALTANRIYFRPLWIPPTRTISDLGCRVSTAAAAGKLLQLALYGRHATTQLPTGNPLAYTGNIAADSAAGVSGDITGANVTLGGWYWGAINSDGAPAIRGAASAGRAEWLIGSTTLANITGPAVGVQLVRYFDQTFGTWPDMTSNSTTEELSTRGGSIYVKAA